MPSTNRSAQRSASPATAPGLPLLYRSPVVLRFEEHKNKGIKPVTDYRFAAQMNAVPLAISEFMPAIRSYPIVFAEGNQPAPVALLGIKQGENLHVDDNGIWRGGCYLPAYVRRYPFILAETPNTNSRALCVDTASDRFTDADDKADWLLFRPDGSATPFAQKMLDLSESWYRHQLQSSEFVKALQAADLLVQQGITFSFQDGRKYNLGGFRVIDADRARNLPADTLKDWNEKGWLNAIALHLASLQNWGLLLEIEHSMSRSEAA